MTKEINPYLSWDISDECQRKLYAKRWKGNQRRIGITGGIASGKSTAGKYLTKVKNLPVLDADVYAREILSPGSTLTNEVIKRYGKSILDQKEVQKQRINRSALAEIIFSNQEERLWLEQLVHPIVRHKLEDELSKHHRSSTIILIIPLLFEAYFTDMCSEVWVIYCSLEEQIKRLMQRDKLSIDQSKQRILTQLSLERKKEMADRVLNNDSSHEKLEHQIEGFLLEKL